jgi:rRNA pseudouridine-1189 N-methylase Emg1 (Nep1/Mra1 family)
MHQDKESIVHLIDRRIREVLDEMGTRPPREKEALAGTVEKLLKAKPLAADHGVNLLEVLRNLDRGPRPLEDEDHEF